MQEHYHQQEQQSVYEHAYHPVEANEQIVYHPTENSEPVVYQQRTPSPLFMTPPPHTDVRFQAVLCYSLGWFSGLLFALFARENRYVRYHAWQSLLFFGSINVIDVAFVFSLSRHAWYLMFLPRILVPFLVLGFLLLNIIAFVGWLVAMFQAYRGTYYKMPFIGDMLAKSFAVGTPLK